MKILTKLFFAVAILFSGQLMAADLSSAKDAGLIGELANGYIGFVKEVPADVKSLVNDINAKRKARYKKIAQSKKIALSDVAKIGGQKAIAKTKSGNFVMRAGEGWTRK